VFYHRLEVCGIQRGKLCALPYRDGRDHDIYASRTRSPDFVEQFGGESRRIPIEWNDVLTDQVFHSLDSIRLQGSTKKLIPCRRRRTESLTRIDPSKKMSGLGTLLARAADEVVRVEADHCGLQASRSS